MKRIILILAVLFLASCSAKITNYDECVAAGNPTTLSYPGRCVANGKSFVQEVEINSFEECLMWGDAVLESYPRSCKAGNKTFTENIEPIISKEEAYEIAKQCVNGSLTDDYYYNAITDTWWIDFTADEENELCDPACVVFEESKTAEINWRCAGVII